VGRHVEGEDRIHVPARGEQELRRSHPKALLTPGVCGSCSVSVLRRKSFWPFCSPNYVEQHEQALLEDRTDHGFAYTLGRGKVPPEEVHERSLVRHAVFQLI
jgi:hypothetical protein